MGGELTIAFGDHPVSVWAQDDDSVSQTELLVDGTVSGTDTTDPYEFVWDTASLTDGIHQVQVRVTDNDAMATTSRPIPILVDNELPGHERVEVELAAGRISSDDAALESVYALFRVSAGSARFATDSPIAGDGTEALLTALRNWENLDPETQDAVVAFFEDRFLDRTPVPLTDPVALGGFAAVCEYAWGCVATSSEGHFEIWYGQEGARAAPMVDMLDDGANACPGLNPNQAAEGLCNGIPDMIDQLAVSFEQAWDVYVDELDFQVPSLPVEAWVWDQAPSGNAVVGLTGPIDISNVDTDDRPYYIARHEFFHMIQRGYFEGPLGWLMRPDAFFPEGLWWNEASAEWATHHAMQASGARFDAVPWYSQSLAGFLGDPELAIRGDFLGFTTQGRFYGAFILGEFLEEWFSADDFLSIDDVAPDPSIIRDIWEEMADGQSPTVAMGTEFTARQSSWAEILPQFARANYLLGAELAGERVLGTIRDPDVTDWLARIDVGRSGGDPDTNDPHVSERQRPGHVQQTLTNSDAPQVPVTIRPGGSAYVEYRLPVNSHAFDVEVYADSSTADLTAQVLAFAEYPTPCLADRSLTFSQVGGATVGKARLYLPQECQFITVIVTNTDPSPLASDEGAIVDAFRVPYVTDDFGRTIAEGWGFDVAGRPWLGSPMLGFLVGSVADGTGVLDISQGLRVARSPKYASPVQDAMMIGRFTNCANPAELVTIDVGARFSLTAGGMAGPAGQGSIDLGIDPCRPWYFKSTFDQTQQFKVWQATSPEPEAWQFEVSNGQPDPYFTVVTSGSGTIGSSDALEVDLIDLTNQPYG